MAAGRALAAALVTNVRSSWSLTSACFGPVHFVSAGALNRVDFPLLGLFLRGTANVIIELGRIDEAERYIDRADSAGKEDGPLSKVGETRTDRKSTL